jgi:serine phosphatase RsbU (regulator of sigma subunit)
MSLLPEKPPSISGWELAAYYRPARLVGGDFYDFIALDDGRYVLVIADVADKGVPAAMFMATCRTLIRAVAANAKSPSESLEQVNRLLMYDNRTDLFFTCWYGILDPRTGMLEYSSGGHNPPLLIHADGHISELRVRGIAIGVVESVKLQTLQIQLQQGDTLLAYTDGLTEAPRADMKEFGEVELHISAVKFHTRSAQEMANKIISAIDRFTDGQPAFDDLTLFVLKCVG